MPEIGTEATMAPRRRQREQSQRRGSTTPSGRLSSSTTAPQWQLALFDKLKHPHPPQLPHAHKAFFLCEVTGGALLTKTDETLGAAYFPIDALPPLSRHRVVESQLRSLHDHVRQGRRHTLFD